MNGSTTPVSSSCMTASEAWPCACADPTAIRPNDRQPATITRRAIRDRVLILRAYASPIQSCSFGNDACGYPDGGR